MAAYLIADNEITDSDLFAEFATRMSVFAQAHGGKYLVRGGPTEVIGGERTPHRVVVIEFPDMATLQAYINAPMYQELAAIRDRSSISTTFIVEGV